MDQHTCRVLDTFITEKISAGYFPGAAYSVIYGTEIHARGHHGYRQLLPVRQPMEPTTVFDLASLTKPLVTAPCIFSLVSDSKLDLDTPVAELVSRFGSSRKKNLTVHHLLTHTSGFPPWVPAYLHAESRKPQAAGTLDLRGRRALLLRRTHHRRPPAES